MRTKDLVLISMYSAMFLVLEYLTITFNILKMPQGGSVSISVLALIFASYHLGVKKALLVSIISIILMFMFQAPVIVHWIQFIFDYFFAYVMYSFSVCFKDVNIGNWNLPTGVVITSFARFMCHNFAGWLFFSEFYTGNVFWGVLAYNLTYMLPTFLLSFVIVMLVKDRLNILNH